MQTKIRGSYTSALDVPWRIYWLQQNISGIIIGCPTAKMIWQQLFKSVLAGSLHPSEAKLFEAIRVRHTNRKTYQIRPVPPETLRLLQDVCIEDGIMIQVADDPETKEKMADLFLQANTFMFSNPVFREELGYWIGQGAFGSPLLISKICQMAVTQLDLGKLEARKDSKALMSASVLAMVCSKRDDKATQVLAGQVFERVWLKATALGFSLQPMTQVLRVPNLKKEAAGLFHCSDVYPQQIFRLGYAKPAKNRTARRPLTCFLI